VSNAAVASWSLLTAGDCPSCSTRVEKKVLRDLNIIGQSSGRPADAAGTASNLHEVITAFSRGNRTSDGIRARSRQLAYATLTSPVVADAEL
jgi:hypothetical protein